MKVSYILAFVAARSAVAFPWVARAPGVDSSKLDYRSVERNMNKRAACPYNANHKGAAAYNSKYPYTGAQNGAPGTQVGGVQVPAPGDTAHAFVAPGANDIRGPCPGLNTAANHNFLSHDGITTFTELVDAQQNLYNVGYDLAVVLATLGVSLDGDIGTQKLSIGCDATSRTSLTGTGLLGQELGLNGHNKFESDTSLTRNDYFLHNGDDYSYNASLFKHMTQTTGGVYDLDGLAQYRYERYQESLATNPNFYFGPKSLLLFGAATFLYELFPGSSNQPDVATISSFFGAGPAPNYAFTGKEKIPAYWKNRITPYTLVDVTEQILAMYALRPVLFGGNAGVGNFDALGSFGDIKNGQLPIDVNATVCLIYQLATENVPSSLSTVIELPLQVLQFVTGKLNPIFKNYGCPLKLT